MTLSPDGREMSALAFRKQRLLERIGRRREACVEITGRLAQTVRLIDTWRERITHWSGFASVLFPFFLGTRKELKKPAPKGRIAGALRWGGLIWRMAKGLRPLTYAFRGE